MEFRVLRYFLAVANEGSITGAAKALNVTQPTLSRQIKDLEEELGKPLFLRTFPRITLTPEGLVLRKRAEEILEMYSKTKSEFNRMKTDTITGNVYIGGGETEAMKIVSSLIKDIHRDYARIHFHLYSGNASDVTERLDKGLLDFGLLITPTELSRYDYITLPVKDVWGVIMRKDSPLSRKAAVMREDLKDLPLICSRQTLNSALSYNEFKEWFQQDFETLNIVATYNLLFNAALLVEDGLGYALTLDKLINTMNHSNVCFRPLQPRLESGISIVWKKYQVFSPAAKIFLEALKRTFTENFSYKI